jgi:hypothetical protein
MLQTPMPALLSEELFFVVLLLYIPSWSQQLSNGDLHLFEHLSLRSKEKKTTVTKVPWYLLPLVSVCLASAPDQVSWTRN